MDKLKNLLLVISFTTVVTVLGMGSMLLLSAYDSPSLSAEKELSGESQQLDNYNANQIPPEDLLGEGALDQESSADQFVEVEEDKVFIDLSDRVPSIVEEVAPSVVSISALREVVNFFGSQELPTSGSGVIFTDDGYIITNNHVIEDSIAVLVTLFDDRSFEATIIGRDPDNDLAVLKIPETENLKPASIGDSSDIRPGEFVIAIGHALNLPGSPTVTVGVVSAVGRTVFLGERTFIDLIQTDALINPGNSGGPLINLDSEIIGINTAIATNAGLSGIQAMGIAFAIPSDTVGPIAAQLRDFGKVITPLIGIYVRDVNPVTAFQEGLPVQRGVLVTECNEGGGAQQAGMLADDIIVALDDKKVDNFGELKKLLRTVYRAGDVVIIRAYRGQRIMEFSVTLQARK